MARKDYKHRASRGKGKQPVPFWVWLLAGFLAGGLSVGYICIQLNPSDDPAGWIGDRPRNSSPGRTVAPPQRTKPEVAKVKPPRFDFYNLLPDQEVLVPEEELESARPAVQPSAPKAEPAAAAAPAPAAKKKYLVQVSSFRSAKEAESLKARLAFLGLQAQVSRADIKGVTWYRVRLGPYASTAAMQEARKRLASSGYQSLPIALRQ